MTFKGRNLDLPRRYRTTNVLVKRDGRWQIVAAHMGSSSIRSRQHCSNEAGVPSEGAWLDLSIYPGTDVRRAPVRKPSSGWEATLLGVYKKLPDETWKAFRAMGITE